MAMEGRNLSFMLRRDEQKNSYKRRDYDAVAEKQHLNTFRTKLPPPVIQ